MLKLRINPIVAKDLKNIKKFMVNSKTCRCFQEWEQIFPNESVSEQTINMQYGKIM